MITIIRKRPLRHPWLSCQKYKFLFSFVPVLAVHPQRLLRNFICIVISGAAFFIISFLFLPLIVHARELPGVQKYIKNGGYALSKNGRTAFSQNLEKNYIPASTIKLITSLAALEILGPDYRFSTRLYLDKEKNLYIQGSGDPFLVSERVSAIAQIVAGQGITEIEDIILDDSAFALETGTAGSENSKNPYDAQCAALGVNFNSLPLRVVHKVKVQSAEPQTPYLPLMGQIGKELTTGNHRVNINAFPDSGSLSNILLYSGQLFQSLFEQHGIKVTGEIKNGHVAPDTALLLNYVAEETVTDLVKSCLLSSNNFMANQLFLAIGAAVYGLPAKWEKSRKAMNTFIHNTLKLADRQIVMVEGSGLSPQNRISPEAMILVLEKFKPYASLIPIKYGVRMKSGTLRKSGVFCYAGYFMKGKDVDPFVILLNQKQNRRDKILKRLYRQ